MWCSEQLFVIVIVNHLISMHKVLVSVIIVICEDSTGKNSTVVCHRFSLDFLYNARSGFD